MAVLLVPFVSPIALHGWHLRQATLFNWTLVKLTTAELTAACIMHNVLPEVAIWLPSQHSC
jgi:hypothetical protein